MTVNVPRIGVAVALALLGWLFWLAGHREWQPDGRLVAIEPRTISGDEPHYLLVLNSLLRDHDLELQDDYRRVRLGSAEAGVGGRGAIFDHHTLFLDKNTGATARWRDVYDWGRRVACPPADCQGFLLRMPQFGPRAGIVEVSAHPVAFPALLAAVIAPLRPTPEEAERRAIEVVGLLAWLACVASYFTGRRAGLSREWALAAALLVGACSPFLAYGRSLFSETTIGLSLVLGLWALQAERPALAALAGCAAMWLKPPFAVVGLLWATEQLWARKPRAAVILTLVTGAGWLLLVIFNYALARTPVIAGVEAWRWAVNLEPLANTFLSNNYGVLYFVPWTLLVVIAAVRARPERTPPRDAGQALLRQIALPSLVYVALLCAYSLNPGMCYGPRYWIPLMPWLGLAVVQLAQCRGVCFRSALVVLALLGALIAIPGALRYRMVFVNGPEKAWRP